MFHRDVLHVIDKLIHKSYIDELNREYHSLFFGINNILFYRNDTKRYPECAYNHRSRADIAGGWCKHIFTFYQRNGVWTANYNTGKHLPKNY